MVKIRIVSNKMVNIGVNADHAIPAVAMEGDFNSNKSGRFWKERSQPTRVMKVATRKKSKLTPYEKSTKERQKRQVIKELTQQLKADIEQASERTRTERRKAKERRVANEKSSMVLQRISRVKALKKLSPHARRRLGIYAQHELNQMTT